MMNWIISRDLSMPATKRFYDQVHFKLAKYSGSCSECPIQIKVDDPVVFLSDYRVTMHEECFRLGPPLPKRNPLMNPKRETTYESKGRFLHLLHSLKGKKTYA